MRDSAFSFTRREWTLIQRLRTPAAVQRYLRALPYNREKRGDTLRTFRGVLRHGTAHCMEGALFAATVLEQHGYPPIVLDLGSSDNLDHVLLLFQKDGLYGTVGQSRYPGLMGRKPLFPTVVSLVREYVEPFVDATGRLISYNVADLRNLRSADWRLGEGNVFAIEKFLQNKPHKLVRTSESDYRRFLARYRRFKKRYPDREPVYYANRNRWL